MLDLDLSTIFKSVIITPYPNIPHVIYFFILIRTVFIDPTSVGDASAVSRNSISD